MAECKLTAEEFVKNTFAPTIAVLCSSDAERLCQKNNLSFVELIQPFCRLTTEVHFRDAGGVQHTLQQLRVLFHPLSSTPTQPTLARKLLSDVVAGALPASDGVGTADVMTAGQYDLQLSGSTPWFEAFREKYLQIAYPAEHEYLNNFLACVFVVSTSNAGVMDQFERLTQQQHQRQHQQPHKLPKWFCPNILTYYVLLSDVVDDAATHARTETMYQEMKTTYGTNSCHLLQINSRHPSVAHQMDSSDELVGTLPDPWAQFLPRKSASMESSEFIAVVASFSENNSSGAFPDVVSEGNPEGPATCVEDAAEVVEDGGRPETDVVDHPLATSPVNANGVTTEVTAETCDGDALTGDPGGGGPVPAPVGQRGQCLTLSDHDRLRVFVQEFVVRSLIPWAERMVRALTEQVATRKGIHRSLFSATKKWFGGNRPTSNSVTAERANVVYTPEAPEMQLRRLGDLTFIFQLYDLSYHTYHTAKRDFNSDHAWLHYAGALEMACMAVFLQGSSSQRQYPHHYMESAISTYLTTCKVPHLATRATLLSTEALKSKGMYAEAAMLFIKMTSEDSDLRSALLLEQAAHCFLRMQPVMVRKYAFHMILSGHRFSKAAQKRHALRAYTQALQVYKGRSWSLAEDHIKFTIGRQCFNLKQLSTAATTFRHLLTEATKQPPTQQLAFLREFLFVYKQQLASFSPDGSTIAQGELPQLPLPVVDSNDTKVLCVRMPRSEEGDRLPATSVYFDHNENENPTWRRLEELALVSRGNSLPPDFRPCIQCFTNRTANTDRPLVVVEEPLTVQIRTRNPLSVPIVLQQLRLLWRFLPDNGSPDNGSPDNGSPDNDGPPPQSISNETASKNCDFADDCIQTQVIDELVLEPHECRLIQLRLTARRTGELRVAGAICRLAAEPAAVGESLGGATVLGKLVLDPQGPRLNGTKQERTTRCYAVDRRLDLRVVAHMPELQVDFCGMPSSLLCGEVRRVTLELRNTGRHALTALRLASTRPQLVTFGRSTATADAAAEGATLDVPVERIVADGCTRLPLWLHAPATAGLHIVHLLFCYESAERNGGMRHRILRHTAELHVQPSLQLHVVTSRGSHHSGTTQSSDRSPNAGSVSLLLEVKNVNSDGRDSQPGEATVTEFSLQQVTCASHRCRIQHLSTNCQSDITIRPDETGLMCFKVNKMADVSGLEKGAIVFTDAVFEKHKISDDETPYFGFYHRSKFAQTFQVEPPAPVMGGERRAESERSIALTLIVRWKAQCVDESGVNRVIIGQHQLDIETIGQPTTSIPHLKQAPVEQQPVKLTRSPSPVLTGHALTGHALTGHALTGQAGLTGREETTSDSLRRLVDVHLRYTQHVQHDFSRNSLCFIPVTISMQNLSSVDLTVQVDTSTPPSNSDPASPLDGQGRPSDALRWTSTSVGGVTLAAHTRCRQRLTACVCRPGVYDLGSAAVWATALPRDGAGPQGSGSGPRGGGAALRGVGDGLEGDPSRQLYGPALLIVCDNGTGRVT